MKRSALLVSVAALMCGLASGCCGPCAGGLCGTPPTYAAPAGAAPYGPPATYTPPPASYAPQGYTPQSYTPPPTVSVPQY